MSAMRAHPVPTEIRFWDADTGKQRAQFKHTSGVERQTFRVLRIAQPSRPIAGC